MTKFKTKKLLAKSLIAFMISAGSVYSMEAQPITVPSATDRMASRTAYATLSTRVDDPYAQRVLAEYGDFRNNPATARDAAIAYNNLINGRSISSSGGSSPRTPRSTPQLDQSTSRGLRSSSAANLAARRVTELERQLLDLQTRLAQAEQRALTSSPSSSSSAGGEVDALRRQIAQLETLLRAQASPLSSSSSGMSDQDKEIAYQQTIADLEKQLQELGHKPLSGLLLLPSLNEAFIYILPPAVIDPQIAVLKRIIVAKAANLIKAIKDGTIIFSAHKGNQKAAATQWTNALTQISDSLSDPVSTDWRGFEPMFTNITQIARDAEGEYLIQAKIRNFPTDPSYTSFLDDCRALMALKGDAERGQQINEANEKQLAYKTVLDSLVDLDLTASDFIKLALPALESLIVKFRGAPLGLNLKELADLIRGQEFIEMLTFLNKKSRYGTNESFLDQAIKREGLTKDDRWPAFYDLFIKYKGALKGAANTPEGKKDAKLAGIVQLLHMLRHGKAQYRLAHAELAREAAGSPAFAAEVAFILSVPDVFALVAKPRAEFMEKFKTLWEAKKITRSPQNDLIVSLYASYMEAFNAARILFFDENPPLLAPIPPSSATSAAAAAASSSSSSLVRSASTTVPRSPPPPPSSAPASAPIAGTGGLPPPPPPPPPPRM